MDNTEFFTGKDVGLVMMHHLNNAPAASSDRKANAMPTNDRPKRYLMVNGAGYNEGARMEEDEEGPHVLYTDYVTLERQLEAAQIHTDNSSVIATLTAENAELRKEIKSEKFHSESLQIEIDKLKGV